MGRRRIVLDAITKLCQRSRLNSAPESVWDGVTKTAKTMALAGVASERASMASMRSGERMNPADA